MATIHSPMRTDSLVN